MLIQLTESIGAAANWVLLLPHLMNSKSFLVFMEITVVCRDEDAGVFSFVDKRSRVVKLR